MDRESEKMFEDMFETFATEGWKHLMEVVEGDLKSMNENVWQVKDKDEILRLQGHRNCLMWLSNYANAIEIAYEDAKNSEVEEEEDATV